MIDVHYGMTRTLPQTSLAEARRRIVEALKKEGFGVLTEIDVQATLKAKLGVDTAPYLILGACNPPLAHQALSHDPGLGLLLPCNVVVASNAAGDTDISIAKPQAMFQVVGDDAVTPIVEQTTQKLARALESA